jgi:hypothetical protein
MRIDDLVAAIDHRSESESVEYKASFDTNSPAEWLEIIKDVVAIANSGGGAIIFGIDDSGDVSGFDCVVLGKLDPADLTNKVYKYTGQQFANFKLIKFEKGSALLFVILIDGVTVPVVFSKPGTYAIADGKQSTAFSGGTVYFRHGAKSEPGNSDDLRWFLERRIEEIRKSWFEGIVKVVEAPPGSQVEIVAAPTPGEAAAIRLVHDASAPAFRQISVDETHPYRQKEVIEEFNKALAGSKTINPFHIRCVRYAHEIDAEATFCYKMKHVSARYSQAFVDWLIQQYTTDPAFFEAAKIKAEPALRSVSAKK